MQWMKENLDTTTSSVSEIRQERNSFIEFTPLSILCNSNEFYILHSITHNTEVIYCMCTGHIPMSNIYLRVFTARNTTSVSRHCQLTTRSRVTNGPQTFSGCGTLGNAHFYRGTPVSIHIDRWKNLRVKFYYTICSFQCEIWTTWISGYFSALWTRTNNQLAVSSLPGDIYQRNNLKCTVIW